MEGKKRKREDEIPPLVTYHALGRTFDRLFKEKTLEETKRVVRQKLALHPDTHLKLEQLREGKPIDLEDDDDFAALRVLARSVLAVNIRVTIDDDDAPGGTAAEQTSPTRSEKAASKKKRKSQTPAPAITLNDPSQSTASTSKPKSAATLKKKKSILDGQFARKTGPLASTDIPGSKAPEPSTSSSSKPKSSSRKRKSPLEDIITSQSGTVTAIEPSAEEVVERGVKKRKTVAGEAEINSKPKSSVETNGKGKSKAKSVTLDEAPTVYDEPEEAEKRRQETEEWISSGVGPTPKSKSKHTNSRLEETADDSAPSLKRKKSIKLIEPSTSNSNLPTPPETVNSEPIIKKAKSKGKSLSTPPEPAPVASTSSLAPLPITPIPAADPPPKKRSRKAIPETPAAVNDDAPPPAAAAEKVKTKASREKGKKRGDDSGHARDTSESGEAPAETSVLASKPKLNRKSSRKSIAAAEEIADNVVEAVPQKNRRKSTSTGDDTFIQSTAGRGARSKTTRRPPAQPTTPLSPNSRAAAEAFLLGITSVASVEAPTQSSIGDNVPERAKIDGVADIPKKFKTKRSKSKSKTSTIPEDAYEPERSPPIVLIREQDDPRFSSSVNRTSQPPSDLLPLRASSVSRKKTQLAKELPCPICLQTPFHLRYRCPVYESGTDAIERRLNELKEENTGQYTLLIEELDQVLRKKQARAGLSVSGSSPAKPAGLPSSRKPIIPSGSKLSEVNVEAGDEGSSNESSEDEGSDSDSVKGSRASNSSAKPHQPTVPYPGLPSLDDVDLDALIWGPRSHSKSILDEIPSQSDSDKDQDDDGDEAAEDDAIDEDEEDDRRYRLRSKKFEKDVQSSDEGEDADVPVNSRDNEGSVDEEMAEEIPGKVHVQSLEELDPAQESTTPQVDDGSNGSGVDDDDKTQVAVLAGHDNDSDASMTDPITSKKEKDSLLAPVLDDNIPVFIAKPIELEPGSPIEEVSLEAVPDGILPSQSHAKQQNIDEESDPIEPADDLVESTHSEGEKEPQSSTRVESESPRTPGRARRMKTRSGKIPQTDLPPGNIQSKDAPKSSSMPPPPIPDTQQPAKRGRYVRLKGDEKATRKMSKADEKVQKTAAKLAEKDAKAKRRVEALAKKEATVVDSEAPKGSPEVSSPVGPSTPLLNSQPAKSLPPSLDKWATIGAVSPEIPDSSPMMVDELHSSSYKNPQAPPSAADSDPNSADPSKPLFLHSNSQVPFPYSQWQAGSSIVQPSDSPTESDSDEDTTMRPKRTPRITSSSAPKYRRLTDIASQAMFSQDILSPTPFPLTPVFSDKSKATPGGDDDDDEEDDDEDEDSGSDSEAERKSHIPKSRRAGNSLRRKRKVGLLSYA